MRTYAFFLSKGSQLFLHVEARTGFGRKLVVTVDGGVRELLLQLPDEIQQGSLLFNGSGVLRLAILG